MHAVCSGCHRNAGDAMVVDEVAVVSVLTSPPSVATKSGQYWFQQLALRLINTYALGICNSIPTITGTQELGLSLVRGQ